MIRCALFDLDGTLVDTSVDLGRATAFVMESYGKAPKWTNEDYISFVGDGARKLLDRAFEHQLSESMLDEAMLIFKKKYNEILIDNASIYDGITNQLEIIKAQGIRLAVVTNKPCKSAELMVKSLFGDELFDYVVGAEDDKPKKPNPYLPAKALSLLNIDAKDAVFFGDSNVDIETARNVGAKSVACSWGFRSRESLISANPDIIIDTPKNISKLFEKKC